LGYVVTLSVEEKLSRLPTYSQELGLDPSKPRDRFKWFLASLLFAKRISADTAKKTYHRFEEQGLVTPEKILAAGWDRLVQVLDSGGYTRYDFSAATNLLNIMRELKGKYGDLEELNRQSNSPKDLEKRLREFKGVGPVTVNIFLRELRTVWDNAKPEPSKIAIEAAKRIGLKDIEPYESALVRLSLENCKKTKCEECPVRDYCKKRGHTKPSPDTQQEQKVTSSPEWRLLFGSRATFIPFSLRPRFQTCLYGRLYLECLSKRETRAQLTSTSPTST
jgi:endonuclease III